MARHQYDGRVLEEQKLRTVILGGLDEIFVICSRNGHGSLWKRFGELASWRVSELICYVIVWE